MQSQGNMVLVFILSSRQLGVQHVCQISGVLKKPVALFQEKRDLALNCVDVEFVVTLTVISHSEIQ